MSMPDEDLNQEEEKSPNKLSRLITVISGFVVGAVLLITVGATLFTWATEISWVSDESSTIDYPIKGETLVIADVDTFWVKTGDDYTPSSAIKLHRKTLSGNLQCRYINERKRTVGKPFSAEYSKGKIAGKKKTSFTATEGITEEGTLNAYLTGQTDSWYLAIFEGATTSESISDYKEILRVPISRKFKN